MLTLSKVLITIGILIYGIAPPLADLNPSHLFHPDWTPHSRVHMAWLLATNSSIACLAGYFLWVRNQVGLSVVLSLCVLGGFWVAALTRSFYSGTLSDFEDIDSKIMGFDGNAFFFGFAVVIVVLGWLMNRIADASESDR